MHRILSITILLWGAFAAAQNLSVSGPAVAPSGAGVTLTVSLAAGGGPAGVQWDMTGIPSGATVASSVSGKTANCTTSINRCIISGTNATAIPDGPIATIKYTQPASAVNLGVTNPFGASPAGAPVTITVPTNPLSVGVQSNCDINGDGKVDSTDEGLILQSALASTTGTPTVLDVIRVVIAANGGACLR